MKEECSNKNRKESIPSMITVICSIAMMAVVLLKMIFQWEGFMLEACIICLAGIIQICLSLQYRNRDRRVAKISLSAGIILFAYLIIMGVVEICKL